MVGCAPAPTVSRGSRQRVSHERRVEPTALSRLRGGREGTLHFRGRHKAKFDAKCRVAVPARLRERVPESERDRFVLTPLPEGCLVLYTNSEWDKIEAQLTERFKSSLGEQKWRDLERYVFGRAEDVSCDRQGRILIPSDLRDEAGLDREVLFVGVRNRIELWDTERWKAGQGRRAEVFEETAKDVLG